MYTSTPDHTPSPEGDDDPWQARFQRAYRGSRRTWEEYVQSLPEAVRGDVTEKVGPQPDVFFYDSVSTLTTLMGAALVYHSGELITERDGELTREMFELGNRLLTEDPDDTPMGQEYADWLDGQMESICVGGGLDLSSMTEAQEASRAEFEAALEAAEQRRQRDLARAVELLPHLWH